MRRLNQYREVKKFPEGGLSVEEYADIRSISPQHVYKIWRQHRDEGKSIDFEIVIFKKHNYVIRKKQKA